MFDPKDTKIRYLNREIKILDVPRAQTLNTSIIFSQLEQIANQSWMEFSFRLGAFLGYRNSLQMIIKGINFAFQRTILKKNSQKLRS